MKPFRLLCTVAALLFCAKAMAQPDLLYLGSIAVYNCKNRKDMGTATEMCMTKTSGIMAFDINYIESLAHWNGIKDGFKKSNAL